MKTDQVKRGLIAALIVIGGISGLIIDNSLGDESRALAQMVLWTALLLAFLFIQLSNSLRRPVQMLIAAALTGVHVGLLILFRNHFPLSNMIVGFLGIAVEAVIFVFLYARIGQSLDPKGPFGMTDAERDVRSLKKAARRKLFSHK